MASVPNARTEITETAGAVAGGQDTICVWGPVPNNADCKPVLYGNWAAIYARHGYSKALEYCALHAQGTGKNILFCGMPISTPGAIGRENTSGKTGTCVTTLTAGSADAAFVITLPPGVYSAVASGVGDTTGIALVEIYVVP